MIGYFYEPQTYRFTGVSTLQRNPKRKETFLVPPNCTLVKPPEDYTPLQHPIFNADTNTWYLGKSQYALSLDTQKEFAETAFGTPLYEKNINGDWVERRTIDVEAEDKAKEIQMNYETAVAVLKNTMDTAIVSKAFEITKATSIESAQAFIQAYQLRAANPELYTIAGLRVYYPIENFSLLDNLDTAEKIRTYYTSVLIELDLFREEKILEFITQKNALPTI